MDTLMNERKRYVKNVILWQQVDNFHDEHVSYFEYTIIELIGVFKINFEQYDVFLQLSDMVGHLFQIMTRYTCGFFPRILAIIPATRYTCVFLSRILAFYSQVYDHFLTNAHIYAHKKSPYICVTNKYVVYTVAESRRIRGTELYRQQKTPSCTMEMKSNFSLNQAWPQCSR